MNLLKNKFFILIFLFIIILFAMVTTSFGFYEFEYGDNSFTIGDNLTSNFSYWFITQKYSSNKGRRLFYFLWF